MTKVYVANGHGHKGSGGFDPGAVSADGRLHEQSAGDHIVAETARLLRSWGADVKDEANRRDPNFPGTIREANAWGADYVVEVHHDWNRAPEGAFGHWYSGAGQALADAIQRQVGRAGFPLRGSWHKRRADLAILKGTLAPCVLYEVGRIGQAELDTPAELRAMGAAIALGIADHIGVKPPAVKPPVEAAVVTPGPFPDVPTSHAHAAGIAAAAEAGLLLGKADGRFYPNEPVTRGQLATVLSRLLVR